MCRYNSGVSALVADVERLTLTRGQFFYRHPLLHKYKYYWRVK